MRPTRTFNVGVEPKTPEHPFFDEGSSNGYTINGEQGKELELERGKLYRFKVNTPGHPFYFTTSETGGCCNFPGSLMETEQATEKGTIDFMITDDLPDQFFYQCGRHPKMGGHVRIKESETIDTDEQTIEEQTIEEQTIEEQNVQDEINSTLSDDIRKKLKTISTVYYVIPMDTEEGSIIRVLQVPVEDGEILIFNAVVLYDYDGSIENPLLFLSGDDMSQFIGILDEPY